MAPLGSVTVKSKLIAGPATGEFTSAEKVTFSDEEYDARGVRNESSTRTDVIVIAHEDNGISMQAHSVILRTQFIIGFPFQQIKYQKLKVKNTASFRFEIYLIFGI
jgi:hypothetical protein